MTVNSQEITTVVNHSMFSISKMLRTAVSYKPIKLGSTYTSVERLKVRVSFSRKTQNLEKKLV